MHQIKSEYGNLIICEELEIFKKIVQEIEDSVKPHNKTTSVALTGGSTPKSFYKWAASHKVFKKPVLNHIQWMTSDERYVPLESPESNFGNADRLMLSPLSISPKNKYPWDVTASPPQAAKFYNDHFFPNSCFDLCLLGMGDDCHIASIFPNSPLISAKNSENFTSIIVPEKGTRLTITPQGLNYCHKIIMIVTGTAKSGALKKVLHGPFNPLEKPAQLHKNWASKVTWLIDPSAAKSL
ncbi:MAG: 6-phosphogluconolactonase [Verrucomicrobia bacterium]|nr:MAG: 6-phosphogluconolactonase [Verrucomicrobiota bacterium]